MSRAIYGVPVFALVATFLAFTPGAAQESTTRGFTLGVHAQGSSLTVEGGDQNSAGGGGVRVGYGLNRIVTLYAQFDGAQFDVLESNAVSGDWTMGHVDVGARFHFANSLRSWVPYLEAAFTGRVVEVTNAIVNDAEVPDVSFNGGAFTVGGGLMAYFTETFALDVELAWSGGEFTEVDVGSISVTSLDIDANSSRLSIGIAWWP
jgi:hypothetical protein